MSCSLFVLFNILLALNAQNTNTTADLITSQIVATDQTSASIDETNSEYKITESPVLWINVGVAIWGLASALHIASRFGDYCLLARLESSEKSLGFLSFIVTAFLVSFCIFSLIHLLFLDVAQCIEYQFICVFTPFKS